MRRLACLLLAFAGCTPATMTSGDPDEPPAPGQEPPDGQRDAGPDDPQDAGTLGDFAAPPVEEDELPAFEAQAPAMRRLTRAQYGNCVTDLLGPVNLPVDLDPDNPIHGFTSIGAREVTIAPRAAEQFEAAAFDVAGQVFGNGERRAGLVGCDPADGACVRDFLNRFGRLAWRRALTGEEMDELAGLHAELSSTLRDPWKALEYTVAAVLQSPFFLFRVEQGEGGRYTDLELASRLSFLIWNTAPDDALLAAAERGELATPAGIEAQARRLLADPRAREAMRHFWGEYFVLDRLDGLTKDAALFPQYTPTLGGAMKREIEGLLDHLVFTQDTDIRTLLTTRTAFIDNELAALYGLPPVEGPGHQQVELPPDSPRGGLLATGGVLALNAHNTVSSPTFRGKFIQNNILCFDIPAPPPGIPELEEGAGGEETTREKLARHASNPSCNGCHQFMDPLGVALENFDAIGAFRTTEHGLPIDASAEYDGVAFEGPRELGQLLRPRDEVAACFARRLYRHGMGQLESEAEEIAVRDLTRAFAGEGHRFQGLILALVTSDAFRLAGEE